MTTLAWGQPLGAVVQFAYVVPDIDDAAARYVEHLNVGPWIVRGPFQPPEGRYRGRPTAATFSIAHAFSGGVMIELIQQHDDSPSVFNERDLPERYGFHHWARLTGSFDDDLAALVDSGYEEAFSDRLPSGSRIVYVDATRDLAGMIELIEHTEAQERVYEGFYRAALDWGGGDPVRRDGE